MPVKARPLYQGGGSESLNEFHRDSLKQRSYISNPAFNNKSTTLLDIPEEGNEGTGHFNMALQQSRDDLTIQAEKDKLITINSKIGEDGVAFATSQPNPYQNKQNETNSTKSAMDQIVKTEQQAKPKVKPIRPWSAKHVLTRGKGYSSKQKENYNSNNMIQNNPIDNSYPETLFENQS